MFWPRQFFIAVLFIGISAPALAAGYEELNAGISARNHQNWRAAIPAFDQAIAAGDLIPSLQFVAYLDRADAHLALNDSAAALADYNAAIALNPNSHDGLADRAYFFKVEGNLSASLQDYAAAISLNPYIPDDYLNRGQVYEADGQGDNALGDFEKAVKDSGGGQLALFELGQGLLESGHFPQAESRLNDTLALIKNASFTIRGAFSEYVWLWLSIDKMKQHQPVWRYPGVPAPNRWPWPIVALYSGDATLDATLAAATQGNEAAKRQQLCEARFYGGVWAHQHGDNTGRSLIQAAMDDCPPALLEWSAARAELRADAH